MIPKTRGNTQKFRMAILKNARSKMQDVIREFCVDNLIEMELSRDEITDIILALKYADDILKELSREIE
tara:strand:+ start:749 stop:955 length:207 start_codon:yes stop_codon:yes gene_type:complete